MMFSDYKFGFADAEKEYTREPQIFQDAFYDSQDIVDKLINQYHFLLIGRKGVGKSAFNAKIQSLAEKDDKLIAFPMQLNDFEFSTFAKTGIDRDVIGTQKYKATWDFILILTSYKLIFNQLKISEVDSFNDMLLLLDALGFPTDVEYKKDITRLSKLKVGNNIAQFDIEFEREFGTKPATYLERISTLTDKMFEVISEICFNDRSIVILIDGVDDILRFKKNQLDILSSLVRSIDYMNDRFVRSKISIKIVLFIREDIISSVTDPDLNKIKRDGSIYLNWNNRLDDLKKIVDLRFKYSGVKERDLESHWEGLFPRKIKNKPSWIYTLDYTLFKPRDVLQYLKCCQEIYPDKVSLSYSEMQNVLKTYSKDYFIEEMKNELTGFSDDELINILPSVFQRLGSRSFTYQEIFKIIDEQSLKGKFKDSDIRVLLLSLFESGYIGQVIPNRRDGKDSIIFKYRNTTARIDYYQEFIIHKGLHSGLGIRL